jgi:cytochrome c553
VVANLTEEDMVAIAAYVASRAPSAAPPPARQLTTTHPAATIAQR